MTQESHKKPTGYWTGETNAFNLFNALKNKDEQEKVLKDTCANLLPAFVKAFNELTGLDVLVEMTLFQESPGSNIIKELNPEENILSLIKEDKFNLEGLFGYSRNLFNFVYNLMLGGNRPFEKGGQLTDLEKIFCEKLNKTIADAAFVPFRDKMKALFKLGKCFDDVTEYQKVKWSFDAYHLTFDVKQENEIGKITLVLPLDILKSIVLTPAGSADEEQSGDSDADWIRGVTNAIAPKEIAVNVRLGHMALPLKTVLNLQENETYPVTITEGGHTVFLNGEASFLSSIGTAGGMRAVQIIDTLQGENNG
ncbi:FliM/FliN family flagellar motor switch protein [bacterium]|nr:FliM/FliN family flagellar motor switch protein [bacterium]